MVSPMIWLGWAFGSAILSATAAVLQKRVLSRMTALEFSFILSFVILLFSLFVPFAVNLSTVPVSTLLIIIAKSILGGSAFLLVMMALERNQISNVLPLLGLTPAVTALLSLFMLGEMLSSWEWVGVGLMMAGTSVLEVWPGGTVRHFSFRRTPSKVHFYILSALGLFAVSSVIDRILVAGHKTDPLVVLLYQHVVYCLMFGAFLWIKSSSLRLVVQKGGAHLSLLLVIALATIAYRFAQLEATSAAPVALVLAVKRTSILFASFVGGRIFSDDRLAVRLGGALLIVGAGFIILRNVG